MNRGLLTGLAVLAFVAATSLFLVQLLQDPYGYVAGIPVSRLKSGDASAVGMPRDRALDRLGTPSYRLEDRREWYYTITPPKRLLPELMRLSESLVLQFDDGGVVTKAYVTD